MNLFDLSKTEPEIETFDQLLSVKGIRIERIVSHGQSTPEGEWYDQAWDEWVIVIQGTASLLLEETQKEVILGKGDSYFLPARMKHRVQWTDKTEPTIWLAVHIEDEKG